MHIVQKCLNLPEHGERLLGLVVKLPGFVNLAGDNIPHVTDLVLKR